MIPLTLAPIRTGDVLLFRGTGLCAWLIKVRTRSVYSHAGIALRIQANGTEKLAVLEALEPLGVRLYPLEQYLKRGERIDWYQLNDPAIVREEVAAYALRQWGKPYALRTLWWSFSRLAWVLRKLLHGRPATDPERFFCSQLVADALKHAGFRADEDVIPIETDPGAVGRFVCLQRRGELSP